MRACSLLYPWLVVPWLVMLIDSDVLIWLTRGQERAKRGLAFMQTQILPLTPAISERAMNLIDAFVLSNGQRGQTLHLTFFDISIPFSSKCKM